ncbi:DUF7139 domain-containing protein [Halomarina oriensis]|uniref:Ribonuclease BN n=1 Tax=Halomarina oriensis TaxID=671145 RepID=A0A6B0GTI8_9EURY|nr:ribonuclease BN [Halomarina oriensis]MWG35445.1 ribonuclease BN [Halomarina oriensis]
MTSLTEVYNGGAGGANLRRLYLGVSLFAVGVVLVLSGMVFATTELGGAWFGFHWTVEHELGITLAGLGVPAVFVGILAVLPSSRRVKAAATAGAAIAVVGVLMFRAVYPENWILADVSYAFPVIAVYLFGTVVTFWCLFVGVANFKTRNDPGGTVKLEITQEGETRVVEVDRSELSSLGGLGSIGGMGGVGLLGNDPDGEVETQTAGSGATPTPSPRSDGGTATDTVSTPTGSPDPVPDSATVLGEDDPRDATDRYCGSCAHFRYVRTGEGLQPYCGVHEELMDDMEPCSQWQRNN